MRGKRIRVRRAIAFFCAALFLILAVAAAALYFYVNSPGFVSVLEERASVGSGKAVRVGSVSFGLLSGLTVRDVTIKEGSEGKPILSLDEAIVEFSLPGLLMRRIKAVNVRGVRVSVDLTESARNGKASEKRPLSKIPLLTPSGPLPVMVELLSLKDLFITVRSAGGEEVEAGPVDLDFAYVEDGTGLLTVSAALPGIPDKLSLSAAVDMESLSLKDGRLETGPVEIGGPGSVDGGEGIPALPVLSAMKGISGTLDSVIGFEAEGEGRSFRIKYEGVFEGIGIRRGASKGAPGPKTIGALDGVIKASVYFPPDLSLIELELESTASGSGKEKGVEKSGVKKAPHRLSFKAAYDTGLEKLTVDALNIDSPVFGKAELKGHLEGLFSDNPAVDAEVRFKNFSLTRIGEGILIPFAVLPPDFVLEGSAERTGRITGSVKGGIKVESKLTLKDFRAGEKGDVFDAKGNHILADASLILFPEDERLVLKRLSVKIPGVTSLAASGSVTGFISGTPAAELDVTLAQTEIGSIKPLLPEAMRTRLESLSVSGAISSSAKVKLAPRRAGVYGLDISLTGAVKRGAFSTGDGYAGGEGVDMEYKTSIRTTLPLKEAAFDVTASASNFALLIGNFFTDFTGKSVSADTKGAFSFESGELTVGNGSVDLAGAASVDFSGGVKSVYKDPEFDAGITLNLVSLGDAYELLLKDNALTIAPALASLKLDGSAKAGIKAAGGAGGVKASGEVKLKLLSLEDEERGFVLEDLALSLPIDLTWPEPIRKGGKKGERIKPPVYGELSVGGVMWKDIIFEGFHMTPVIWQNDFSLAGDVSVPIFGGSVGLKGLGVKSILSPERELSVTVDIDALDLEELSLALGLPPLSGSLAGTISEVRFRGSTLTAEGEILLEVFNGSIQVSAISVEDIFSPAPSVRSDIELRELDLGEITGAFEYGSITGVLEGYVKGLVITDGQPESFEAKISSVRRRGVRQKISVQALKNISVIGSGSAGAVFSTGIYRLFDSYGYSKLGFSGRLKNDNFILMGVDQEGEKGYLVRGGLIPPRVDVVTYSRNVSFKEMVERLKRIETAK